MATLFMSRRTKTHPRARPTCWTFRDAQENWRRCTRSWREISAQSHDQQCFSPTPMRSKLRSSPIPRPTRRKTTKKWHQDAGQHPAFPAARTPGSQIGCLGRASATPTRRGRRCRFAGAIGRPLGCLPPMRWIYALWSLPGLGAPKSRIPLGWSNCGRQ